MDHKLKVFKEVALTKSFTKTAANLFISQPAVSKTIKNLEQAYGKAFFDRKGNHIELTTNGMLFLEYAEQLLRLYAEMENTFSASSEVLPTSVRLGASTTIGQYIIPKITAGLKKEYPNFNLHLICGNTGKIQELVLSGQMDLGIVEGENHDTRLQYEKFVKDELVLVTNANNKNIKGSISIEQLKDLAFVEREPGSGTLEVINNALAKNGIESLHITSVLGSTESIKSYLSHTNHFAFLSIHAISAQLMENQLRIIEVDGLTIERWFYFMSRQGYQSKVNQKLQDLFLEQYNKK
ncbi:DNA-binding transcriptional LysR family regulator [Gillisia sp. Hel_I_86]|uniref:LysR substrate-binding domain-containing protein n=1 Tax=Gillisia sp. Hel_I_86 TaxID=1249981 RepID=UPI00119BF2F4|nr:LysR substrate-binding domain-containing protein [Gillisia sp. Hel_I_86]TVZ26885.1 DNA-binding transcriptional LysR family regulator [Gillisia sp. Hel_I_86]